MELCSSLVLFILIGTLILVLLLIYDAWLWQMREVFARLLDLIRGEDCHRCRLHVEKQRGLCLPFPTEHVYAARPSHNSLVDGAIRFEGMLLVRVVDE